jgi:acyl-CoA dehydrogenase
MDFDLSPKAAELHKVAEAFLHEQVLPAEAEFEAFRTEAGPDSHAVPPILEQLKVRARALGLWNLFLPSEGGLANVEYAPIAELSGWSLDLMPEAMNCQAPDTGNMEVLHMFGTAAQKQQWLEPLLEGRIRSAFAMTEPAVASSDATNIQCSIVRDGDDYVINGRKWWISGSLDPRCAILIVMGKTDPDAARHLQQSQVLVPTDTPGVTLVRNLSVFGYHDWVGHAEITFDDVRVPVSNLIGQEGGGFAIAQARLGPGRIHHCMRSPGAAERALDLMVRRAASREAFGKPLAQQGMVQHAIAESRIEIEQVRLLVLKAAWIIDKAGAKAARTEIAAIKVAAPRVSTAVIDRAIQLHGGAGLSQDTPLAGMYAWNRAMRIFDGPDEVHLRSVALQELGRLQA